MRCREDRDEGRDDRLQNDNELPRRVEYDVVDRYTEQYVFADDISAPQRQRIDAESLRLEAAVGLDEFKISEAWLLWRSTQKEPDRFPVAERNLAFAALYIRAEVADSEREAGLKPGDQRDDTRAAVAKEQPVPILAIANETRFSIDAFRKDVDDHDPRIYRERQTLGITTERAADIIAQDDMHSRIRHFVELDRSSMPDVVRDARRAGAEDNAMLLARAGQHALERDPALCQRVADRLLVPYVAEQLRVDSVRRFWADSLLDDKKRGTYPSYIDGRPDGPVIDDKARMLESYQMAVGVATATLAASWWENHEQCADGGASRRTSAAFNVCRLMCADIIDDAATRKPGLISMLKNWGKDDAARVDSALPAVLERLEAFAENPEIAKRYLPRIDDHS